MWRPLPPRRRGAFVRAWPNPVPATADRARTTISWDTGDGTPGIVALVTHLGDLTPLSGGPTGSVEIDWIQPHTGYRFRLYPIDVWEEDRSRLPAPIAGTKVSMQSDETAEVLADVALLTLAGAVVVVSSWAALGASRMLGRLAYRALLRRPGA